MKTSRQQLGQRSEDVAVRYLQKAGYRIVSRNYTCRFGEIDIIAWEQDVLVFVEVRSKQNAQYGLPVDTINHHKQMNVRKAAENYLYHQQNLDCYCRFDVLSVLWNEQIPQIQLYRDAF